MNSGIEAKGQSPLLSNLLAHIGREQPDLGQLGGALLDMSGAIMQGAGNTGEVDKLRERWSKQTRNGLNTGGATDADVEYFQKDIKHIVELSDPYDSYIFYVPGGGGYVRVRLAIDEDGKPKADLVDFGRNEKVKENFDKLY